MREGFSIGPLTIHYYGVLISIGILAAAWIALRLAKHEGMDEDYIWDSLPWVVLAGVIGARLWHIFTPPQSMVDMGYTTGYYLTNPMAAIAVWNGGLGIPGAVIGGIIAAWVYARRRRISFLKMVDVIVPGLAMAQAIARWGNYINQELYGMPTDLPWAIFIDPAHRLREFADQAYYHPLFLYESIANLLIFGLLLWMILRVKNRLPGVVFQAYLILYPTVRFFLEFLRLDPSNVRNLNINQTLMAVTAVSSALILAWRLLRKGPENETGSPSPERPEGLVQVPHETAEEEDAETGDTPVDGADGKNDNPEEDQGASGS